MAMAFSMGYRSLCDNDIQHLYTSFESKPSPRRKPRKYEPGPAYQEQLDSERHQREINQPFVEYIPKWDVELPRAPAFRTYDSKHITRVVKRLTKPKKYNHSKWCDSKTMSRKPHDWEKEEEERREKLKNLLKQFGSQQKTTKQYFEKEGKQKKHKKLPMIGGHTYH